MRQWTSRPTIYLLLAALLSAETLAGQGGARAAELACRTAPGEPTTTLLVGAPTRATAWLARAFVQTTGTRSPGGPSAGALLDGGWLLVLAAAQDANSNCWVRVLLPNRPNNSSAWAPIDRLQLRPTPWRLVVSRAHRTVAVYRAGVLTETFTAVVGRPSMPTPRGLFAVLDVQSTPVNSFYGSWTLRLTAHSQVLRRFDGGDGRVAIHGRGGASLADPLDSALSHGCIRLDNTAIDWLIKAVGASRLPGVPVLVV